MAEGAGSSDPSEPVEKQITFTVKASSNQTYALTFPSTSTVKDVKDKLATKDYADIPAERIRLIYSGRILKDPDSLASCKPEIKDGYTIHMVKGADSNARQNPASSGSASAAAVPPAVPSNIATGTGHDPLAGLTGARYAGFHGLPNASMFGADGGVSQPPQHQLYQHINTTQMGPPPGPEAMLRQLEDPAFAQQMNEALNNPQVIQMLENHPMMRDNPMMRNILRDPNMRRMMMNPEMIRMQLQMQQQMGGGDAGAAFPAPGMTDTTPGARQQPGTQPGSNPATNPLANMFGNTGASAANPFAALFPGAAGAGTTPATSPPPAASAGGGTPSDQAQANPFANLFGAPPAGGGAAGGNDPIAQMTAQMMQNPEMMRSAMQMMGMNAGGAAGEEGAASTGANPFAGLLGNNPYGAFGGAGAQPPAPADTRPPEERYESQLRQLNDMGFYEFDRNVTALRRSGGSVQGAIEFLLGGGG